MARFTAETSLPSIKERLMQIVDRGQQSQRLCTN
jgi:hypothetical protein